MFGRQSHQAGTLQRRSQVFFASFAILMACTLIVSLIGPVAFDALLDDDDSSNDEVSVDTAVEEALRATAESGSDDPFAYLGLANYLANTGRLSEAIPWYERGIELAPDNSTNRLDFARSLANGGFRQDAELQFQRAVELEPQNAQAHFYLAELYASWVPPRTNEALTEYERTIEAGPESFVAEQAAERIAEMTAGTASPDPVD
jgi:tetratricopeptide (TPR) repeat protein